MPFADTFLPEFDNEMRITRTMLERVPFDGDATKPNPKSRTLVELASHIANVTHFGSLIAETEERDFSTPGAAPPATYEGSTELLDTFDRNVAASRAAIESLDESKLGDKWTLRRGEKVMISLPKAAAFRALLMSHLIHHRGQLSAYLRLNDIPHPPIYGPTAEMMPT
jgi:uncharacterized damage-inducible protein DinB